jgi:hypothetical protein
MFAEKFNDECYCEDEGLKVALTNPYGLRLCQLALATHYISSPGNSQEEQDRQDSQDDKQVPV